LPPAPIAAMFSFSFGDLNPSCFSERTLPKPPAGTAPASSEPRKKWRREKEFLIRGRVTLALKRKSLCYNIPR
jgi:hypothetical protein